MKSLIAFIAAFACLSTPVSARHYDVIRRGDHGYLGKYNYDANMPIEHRRSVRGSTSDIEMSVYVDNATREVVIVYENRRTGERIICLSVLTRDLEGYLVSEQQCR